MFVERKCLKIKTLESSFQIAAKINESIVKRMKSSRQKNKILTVSEESESSEQSGYLNKYSEIQSAIT